MLLSKRWVAYVTFNVLLSISNNSFMLRLRLVRKMSEWYYSQKKQSSNTRKLLQERIEKSNLRRELTVEEAKRLAKLEQIAEKLKCGEIVLQPKQRNNIF